jgi:p-hydroxybenzoate 3-monooxygenase
MAVKDPVVCVVGAGPAGLVVAQLLQRAGVSFILLERQRADRLHARVKAGMIEHRTVELLRRRGLAETIVGCGSRIGTCEFCVDGEAFVLDYAARCGGQGHYIYPQHELVRDWVERLAETGADLRFETEVTGVEQDNGAVVTAIDASTGESLTIECEAVACCDGAASGFGAAFHAASLSHPFRWLTLMAGVPPSSTGTIYGLHRRGFAGQMHRSATMTRFMLEVPAGASLDEWPDERIWVELQDRLAVAGRRSLEQGEFLERDILDHRVRVCEPMQQGRVFLAGDAAHLITPAGGKGMNMAIQDAVELAEGLCECYGEAKSDRRLVHYSRTRLPSIWRQQEFSNLMLSLFHVGFALNNHTDGHSFSHGLRRARLHQIVHDPTYSEWFAHAYVGLELPPGRR